MDEILWQAIDERQAKFLSMDEEQAQAFFAAYLARRDERVQELIRQYVLETGGSESDLDFSIDSLVPLWQWSRDHIQYREHTDEELQRIMSIPVEAAREQQLSVKSLSQDSLAFLSDVAFYFAEVLIRNFDGVHWKVCKSKLRRYHDKNKPVLGGFAPVPIDPRSWVTGAAHRALDGKTGDEALLESLERAYERLGQEEML